MSAEKTKERSGTQAGSKSEQKSQPGALFRSSLPIGPARLFDPMGLFEDSFSVILRMQQEMNRIFSQLGIGAPAGQSEERASNMWVPAVELSTKNGNLVIAAELPGLTEQDVKVEVGKDVLIIQGERKLEKEEEGEGGIRRTERRYGRFYRAIALPEDADTEHSRAEFENGVLKVTIPVPETAGRRREIPVQASSHPHTPAEKKPAA